MLIVIYLYYFCCYVKNVQLFKNSRGFIGRTCRECAEAVRQVSDVANHINDHIKQQDNFMRMLAIQKSLACPVGPRILVPGRVFIKEGQLKKVSDRTFANFESSKIYVLQHNEFIVYCECVSRYMPSLSHCSSGSRQ